MNGETETVRLAILTTQVDDLLKWRIIFMEEFSKKIERLEKRIEELIVGRPTWTTTILLTTLASAVVGLAVKQFG